VTSQVEISAFADFAQQKSIQQKVSIQLDTWNDSICSHIITDKQWLQENLLCLLSNAAKYSLAGDVFIRGFLSGGSLPVSDKIMNLGSSSAATTIAAASLSPSAYYHHQKVDNHGSSYQHLEAPPIGHTDKVDDEHPTSSVELPDMTMLVIEVEDTGIGVSEEAARSLFHPFQQTQRLAGGTGLGLYSLARRIEALQGKCGVKKRSDGEQGSVFWFSIPYRPDEGAAQAWLTINAELKAKQEGSFKGNKMHIEVTRKESSFISTEIKVHSGYRILLAEDSPSVSKLMIRMLTHQGHQVDHVENGAAAVDKYRQSYHLPPSASPRRHHVDEGKYEQPLEPCQPYDVILMDLQMPIMDGLEAVTRIRAIEREQISSSSSSLLPSQQVLHQFIIGVSANSDEETKAIGSTVGIDYFIPKPFKINVFNEVMMNSKI
jgi:CheY-like chemotaxis protein